MPGFLKLSFAAMLAGILVGFGTLGLAPLKPTTSSTIVTPAPIPSAVNVFLAASAAQIGTSGSASTPTETVQPTSTAVPPSATTVPLTPLPSPAVPIRVGSAGPPSVSAWSVAVVDEQSGALLYSRDPHRRLPPASLTKVFTALVALQHGDLHQPITAQFDQTELVDSTLMGLKVGDSYTLEDLLYGLMLPSGNDAALVVANTIAGSEPQFADMMNAQATSLGLTDSHFVNAHGLDATGHYSSAYDLAMAARYGMIHFPEFQSLAKAKAWQVTGTRQYWVYNLNRFLRSYNGADGVKIGYTDNAGPGIVASATRNGHRVFVALLHCGDIVGDSTPLFNWVWANFQWPAQSPTPTPTGATSGGA